MSAPVAAGHSRAPAGSGSAPTGSMSGGVPFSTPDLPCHPCSNPPLVLPHPTWSSGICTVHAPPWTFACLFLERFLLWPDKFLVILPWCCHLAGEAFPPESAQDAHSCLARGIAPAGCLGGPLSLVPVVLLTFAICPCHCVETMEVAPDSIVWMQASACSLHARA